MGAIRVANIDDRAIEGPYPSRDAPRPARWVRDGELAYMMHPSFLDPDLHAEILGPMPGRTGEPALGLREAPPGIPPHLACLYEVPLLTREEEIHLFRRMNYLKYRADCARRRADRLRPSGPDPGSPGAWLADARLDRDRIIRANLRLVASVARRFCRPGDDLPELISEGNVALLDAVERFDFSRGYRFSTYATWAVKNRLVRLRSDEGRRGLRFVTGFHDALGEVADRGGDRSSSEPAYERMRVALRRLLGQLDERELVIVVGRHGLDGAGKRTLAQLGRQLGITKERVRQIEGAVREKLRRAVGRATPDPAWS